MKIELPNNKYVITERDICDILIAYNNQDYDWILDFFETLHPIEHMDELETYTFEQIIANAGIVSYQGKK
ncbi:hypothetical protein HOE22_04510 [Candidatus Woesearchaeota archaeon]|jgi:hypothetical protein|nr:hypothetical protein [Candidatus Woesearchaeota archaeon]MBT7556370.1 hypothetical protein [Candidatus Woesearchaeota archaeon]